MIQKLNNFKHRVVQDRRNINRDEEIKKRRCSPNRRKYEFADRVEMYNSRNVIIKKVDHAKADARYVRKLEGAKERRKGMGREWA